MKSPTKVLLTAGLGAVAMYYLDPAQGRTRRDLARERIEYGRDGLERASHTARAVGHDVGNRADRTMHRLRAVGHGVGERADGAFERARAVGHDFGVRAGRLTRGLKSVGLDTGYRAAGAVSTLGSLFGGRHSRRSARPLKFIGIPVLWLFAAGIGASVMYLFDPSQGIYRRARLRSRLPRIRTADSDSRGSEAANDTDSAEPLQPGTRARAGDARMGKQERPLPG